MSDPTDLYGLMCLATPELAAAIAPKSLRMAKETCVDKELSRHLADIIYDALSRDGQRFKISTLIEHKSQWEHAMGLLLQLLRYNLNFFQEAHTLLLSQGEEMPVPINIVLYHGERPLGDLAFIRQFRHNLSESLQKRLLNFEPVLIDLGQFGHGEPPDGGLSLFGVGPDGFGACAEHTIFGEKFRYTIDV